MPSESNEGDTRMISSKSPPTARHQSIDIIMRQRGRAGTAGIAEKRNEVVAMNSEVIGEDIEVARIAQGEERPATVIEAAVSRNLEEISEAERSAVQEGAQALDVTDAMALKVKMAMMLEKILVHKKATGDATTGDHHANVIETLRPRAAVKMKPRETRPMNCTRRRNGRSRLRQKR